MRDFDLGLFVPLFDLDGAFADAIFSETKKKQNTHNQVREKFKFLDNSET